MLFNSYVFVLFFLVYWKLGRVSQNRFLLVASYLFYGWWDWRFLGLIALSTAVDYLCGLRAGEDKPGRKKWLIISLVTNLGILGFFKYFGFFVDSVERVLALFGLSVSSPVLEVVLPVGISFYTFQSLSYTIDVYRGSGSFSFAGTRTWFRYPAEPSCEMIFPGTQATPLNFRAGRLGAAS